MEYVLTFTNNETVVAYFDLEDSFSSNLIFVAADSAGSNNIAPNTALSNKIIWEDVEVAPNTTETIRVRMQINPGAGDRDEYTNTFAYDYFAIYDCNLGDDDLANNYDPVPFPFDLALTKKPADMVPLYAPGDDVPFVIEVTNQ